MFSSPKAPAAPDPSQTAALNQAGNVNTAVAQAYLQNPSSQSSPFGTATTSISGYESVKDAEGNNIQVPRFATSTTLSEPEQRKYDQENALAFRSNDIALEQLNRANDIISQEFNAENILPQMKGDGSFDTYRGDVYDSMYGRWNDDFTRQQQQERDRLLAQGVTYGSEAYTNARDMQATQRNDALLALDIQSRNAALQHQQADRGERDAALREAIAIRTQPLNEIAALATQSQVNVPQFSGFQAGAIQPTNVGSYIQADYNNRLNQYYDQQNQRNAMMSGLFGLGATGMRAATGGFF